MTRIAVVSGLSGAGRSVAAGAFEDLGWFVIDNLPGALVSKVGELALSGTGGYDRVALVLGGYDEEVSNEIEALRAQVEDVRAVFLEASTDVLVRRYESTKRRHPHIGNGAEGDEDVGLVEAIERERTSLGPARAAADLVIDTSALNPHQLRERIGSQFQDVGTDTSMRLTLTSFGFKHGLPLDVDLVFDCRFLPNPHWDPDLRSFSGKDPEIQEYVVDRPAGQRFLADLEQMLEHLLPQYEEEGKSYLTVAFGCTGGRHRSVAIAEAVGRILKERGWNPRVTHRDIDR
ncbi:MAG: RNase adapter RapZ [Acidimicrobiales bacterium]